MILFFFFSPAYPDRGPQGSLTGAEMALEMLEPRKGPGAIFTRQRLALVGGDVFLSRLSGNYFLFVHCEQQRWQLESVRQFRERSSGEEKLWGSA